MTHVPIDIYQRALILNYKYNLKGVDEELVFTNEFGTLEHCVHELSHAAVLGIPWRRGQISSDVGRAFPPQKDRHEWRTCYLYSVWNEAYAWAVEWHALDVLLGDGNHMKWEEAKLHAAEQGVEGEHLENLMSVPIFRDLGEELAEIFGGAV